MHGRINHQDNKYIKQEYTATSCYEQRAYYVKEGERKGGNRFMQVLNDTSSTLPTDTN